MSTRDQLFYFLTHDTLIVRGTETCACMQAKTHGSACREQISGTGHCYPSSLSSNTIMSNDKHDRLNTSQHKSPHIRPLRMVVQAVTVVTRYEPVSEMAGSKRKQSRYP
ncbi:hypothetical protein D6C85_03075 [Aureobasidium pullulans]|uniref:Uncharacterized protein n=1 Tax=Aureobasidium pullulans TaxID=5580 RepID=A0A4S9XBD0_AURPU|nr:hypothetical protein D6C85_03075 [Aureobasidium pullulans]